MIEDMALLKRTMQQMDAEDPVAAQTAKDHAAQILGDAKLNFAKMAELIEQRRLLLPPAILGRIKKMDQPGMLGDGAFQDTGTALRREGLSFLQIAEAIEASDRPAPAAAARSNAPVPVQESESFFVMDDEPHDPAWLRVLLFIGRIVLFPVRHPLRSLAIGLFALILLYGVRGAVVLSEWASGYSHSAAAVHRVDTAISSVKSFVHERISPQKEESASPTPTPSPTAAAAASSSATPPATSAAAPQPSASPAATAAAPPPSSTASAGLTTAPATPVPGPTASQSAALAPPQIAPAPSQAGPAAPYVPPSKSAANSGVTRDDRYASPRGAPFEDSRRRVFQDTMPEWFHRNSRRAAPCSGGVGGCYWGGGQF